MTRTGLFAHTLCKRCEINRACDGYCRDCPRFDPDGWMEQECICMQHATEEEIKEKKCKYFEEVKEQCLNK
jgi:hypothetical protein